VRDTAKAHVLALENRAAKGRYLTVSPEKFTWKKVPITSQRLRDRFPHEHIPKGTVEYTVRETARVDVRKAERDMGFGWTTLAKSFGDMAEQFYKLKREGFPD
jgi:nucleoside-diphosphate-sugar epimerase